MPILGCFERAGRTFSCSRTHQATQGELFRAQDPAHGDFETNDTSARPQQGSLETGIASAPENCTKNTHLAPAKAMAVSVEAQPARAKATPVSRERFQMMVGGGRAWPGDQWAADVTNVVKPKQFEPPCECSCYKRRQSNPKNHYFQRKSPRIDDVCNNGSEIHTKNTSD